MKEVFGDFWTYPASVKCITTNGITRHDGSAVMGRGIAYQATQMMPGIEVTLGASLRLVGNHVRVLGNYLCPEPVWMISFPVKHHWRDRADLMLIERSARELLEVAPPLVELDPEHRPILVPRPGCGNGQLEWADVGPVLAPIFDDRFHIITLAPDMERGLL